MSDPNEDRIISVLLLGVPVALHHRVAEHQQALQREFDILRAGGQPDDVPAKLAMLIEELEQRYGGTNDRPWGELDDAGRRGLERVDLVYEVPAHAADAAQHLSELLEEADEFCRSGDHLLTIRTPDDARRYRRWFLGEFVRQRDGAEPLPWEDRMPDDPADPVDPADRSGRQDERRPTADVPTRIVRPVGVVDLQTAGALRDDLAPTDGGAVPVALDLSDVEFIDSVGMSVIVSAHRRLSSEGADLTVVVPPQLTPTFRITGLDGVLDITFT